MRRLILFLALLIVSVWLGLKVVHHPGFLLLVYQPWMVQMPLWFALLSLIVAFLVFYLLIDSIDRFHFLVFRVKNWLRFRREQQSYSKTQQGLSYLIEGRWEKAERSFLGGVNQTVDPMINYLGAAKAAQEQKAYERRDQYIQKAYHVAPHSALAIGLTQAELEWEQNQLEHAIATLNHLRQKSPRHPRILKLLEKIYARLGDWQNLLLLLPSLRKAKLLTVDEAEIFEKNMYCEILMHMNTASLDELHHVWHDMPRAIRKNSDVVAAYVKQILRFPETKEAEDLIRKTLKYTWHPTLVTLYGSLPFTQLNRQLVVVGAWLKIYGPHPELLLVLGKLCVRVQLWGKAKDYFERCLATGPYPLASLEYGKLLEQLHEKDEALKKYKEGLMGLAVKESELAAKYPSSINTINTMYK